MKIQKVHTIPKLWLSALTKCDVTLWAWHHAIPQNILDSPQGSLHDSSNTVVPRAGIMLRLDWVDRAIVMQALFL